MSVFAYTAYDTDLSIPDKHRRIRSRVEADSESAAWDAVRALGYAPVAVKEVKTARNPITAFLRRLSVLDQLSFYRSMAMFERSKTPRDKSLAICADAASNRAYSAAIRGIAKRVEAGGLMSDAMAAAREFFSSLQVAMVTIADRTNHHADIFERMTLLLKRDRKVGKEIVGALVYPALTGVLSGGVIGSLIWLVIPQFENVFAALGKDLPLATRLVVYGAKLMSNPLFYAACFLGCVGSWYGYRFAMSVPTVNLWVEAALDRAWIVGPVRKKMVVGRACRLMGLLLEARVPEAEVLKLVSESSGHRGCATAFKAARETFLRKGDLPEAMKETGFFPPLVIGFVKAAYEAKVPAVPEALREISELYDTDVDDAIGRATKIIEPISIAFLSLAVSGIIIALYLPFLDTLDLTSAGNM